MRPISLSEPSTRYTRKSSTIWISVKYDNDARTSSWYMTRLSRHCAFSAKFDSISRIISQFSAPDAITRIWNQLTAGIFFL